MDYNWLSPSAEARPVGDNGWGIFARETIPAGTTVAAFGGWSLRGRTLATLHDGPAEPLHPGRRRPLPRADESPSPATCSTTRASRRAGSSARSLLVALRDIEVGEELTFDYATCDGTDYDEFVCACGEPTCRGTVTGRDWLLPELQERYAGWFSPYLARRIAALPAPLH